MQTIKGAPWNLHLGALGTKMVPQARARAPNAVAVPAVDPIPELMPPPGGMPRAPLAAEAARGSEDTGHGVSDLLRDDETGVPRITSRSDSSLLLLCKKVAVPQPSTKLLEATFALTVCRVLGQTFACANFD